MAPQAIKTKKQSKEASSLLKALSHEARLKLLCDLVEGEKSVTELQHDSGLSPSAFSQHLALLRTKKLVATRKEGLNVFYRLDNPVVIDILNVLYKAYCKA